jgi:hypothetical protein
MATRKFRVAIFFDKTQKNKCLQKTNGPFFKQMFKLRQTQPLQYQVEEKKKSFNSNQIVYKNVAFKDILE